MPEPKDENLNEVLERVLTYIERRASNKVKIIRLFPSQPVMVRISASLFEWVIENLCKNAIDAMDGQGVITLSVVDYERKIEVNVEDTGKGISKSHRKSVFTPGFTTKKRGWGLGLSLAKRIVEEYHKGRIYVKSSEVNKGTIFSIELKK
jgi:signal transduction histidine kinase